MVWFVISHMFSDAQRTRAVEAGGRIQQLDDKLGKSGFTRAAKSCLNTT